MIGKVYANVIELGLGMQNHVMQCYLGIARKHGNPYALEAMEQLEEGVAEASVMWRGIAAIARKDGFVPAYRYRLVETYRHVKEKLDELRCVTAEPTCSHPNAHTIRLGPQTSANYCPDCDTEV